MKNVRLCQWHAVEEIEQLLHTEFGRLVEQVEDRHFSIRFPSDQPFTVGVLWTPAVELMDRSWPHRVSIFCAIGEQVAWEDNGLAAFLIREMSDLPLGRLICIDDTVLVEHSLYGDRISPSALTLAVDVIAGAAERTGRVLQSAGLLSAA